MKLSSPNDREISAPCLGERDGCGWSTDQSLSVSHMEGSQGVIATSIKTDRTLHLNPNHAPSLPFLPLPPLPPPT